jgi:hypothetical protein
MMDGKKAGGNNPPQTFKLPQEHDAKEDVEMEATAHRQVVTDQASVSALGWAGMILVGLALWYLIYLGLSH